MAKIGAWLIGARGTLATTAVVGARAMVHGLSGSGGLVTALPEVAELPLVGFEDIVFGGWDISDHTMLERARALAHADQVMAPGLVAAVEDDLLRVDQQVRVGYLEGAGPAVRLLASRKVQRSREPLASAVHRMGDDLDRFRSAHRLETIVVINVASTEPTIALGPEHETFNDISRLIQQDRRAACTPSMLYAHAAVMRGFPYVNFTPSLGISPPGLQEIARKNQVPFYGNDGKTGETLVKTVLAPLFRYRNLEILSWDGLNILGGGDGQVLSEPSHRATKIRSKSSVLGSTLGYSPHENVLIEHVPSLGSWKTAWNHIHFRGFLGTKMTAQVIWQGCDAILAAPLVLDLVRLAAFAHRRHESGPMTQLACFFKNPMGVNVHALSEQYDMLLAYVRRHGRGRGRTVPRLDPA